MNRTLCALVCLVLSLFVNAQSIPYNAIRWVSGLSWEQVKAKAKQEQKCIFVDCFTTWCGPCRRMDAEVYNNVTVADFFNSRFIAVRMQMDRTDKDDANTKEWYLTADQISTAYKIISYPTYLFFSPDGEIIYKDGGYKSPADFLAISNYALVPGRKFDDPYAGYDLLVQEFRKGIKNYAKMPYLVSTARSIYNFKLADSVTQSYIQYLQTCQVSQLYTAENIPFIASMEPTLINEKFFGMFFRDQIRVDAIMKKKGYALSVADKMVQALTVRQFFKEEKQKEQPDWHRLYATITNTYGLDYAERNVTAAKVDWFKARNDIINYNQYFIKQVENNWLDTTLEATDIMLNQVAYANIFERSFRPYEIEAAIKWMKGVVRRKLYFSLCDVLDTYANLLYKSGKKSEALFWEQKALEDAIRRGAAQSDIDGFRDMISKMKKGLPTWPASTSN